MPLVSVIMPTYNSAKFIDQAVQSVLNQTMDDWELLLTDDASTDDTREHIEAYGDERIRPEFLTQNQGAARARNHSIERARGRYIGFLDSDDRWLPEKLERQIGFMQRNKSAFSHTAYAVENEHGELIGKKAVVRSASYADLLASRTVVGCLTAIYDREMMGLVRMPQIRKRQDFALWLHLARQCGGVDGLNEVLSIYRVHSGSLSANKLSAALYTWKMFRRTQDLSLYAAGSAFVRYGASRLFENKIAPLEPSELDRLAGEARA